MENAHPSQNGRKIQLSSTRDAAKAAGVHPVTVLRWISRKKFKPPKKIADSYVWSDLDIERLKAFVQSHYWRRS